MLLAGDLGGTKTDLALIDPAKGPREPVAAASFSTSQFPSLEAMVQQFLAAHPARLRAACFGVAGPVVAGTATITNLGWVLREEALAAALRLRQVRLINDLEAIATALPHLTADDSEPLAAGQPEKGGTVAVIAPGTGLGEAFLIWNGERYIAHPSEGGHCDFAPTNDLQAALLAWLGRDGAHVSYEDVCSGRGIPNLYAFLRARGAPEPPWLHARLAAAADPTPIILNAALQEDPPQICLDTLNLFVDILAAEAGNLALKVLATGGLYFAGGLSLRLLSVLTAERVLPGFRSKGRLAALLERIPVSIITNPKVGLLGAAYAALER
ncbi:MAG: glucokinase [Chloroflexota bacterium]|nr:glucokinase [Dehalococcoidia bacterium]MDW8253999.1 glucokinase [Chloroflexota bacterium]